MKVGFIGNANNFPFMLARAMRKLGHDVEFIVSSDAALDRPENRYRDISCPYPSWIKEIALSNPLDWIRKGKSTERRKAVEILAGCDWVVANQLACSLLPEVNRPSLSLLSGADLFVYCDWGTAGKQAAQVVSRTPLRKWVRAQITRAQFLALIRRQREGIRRSAFVSFFPPGTFREADTLFKDLGVTLGQRVFHQMTDVDDIPPSLSPDHEPIRVFCGTRHNWVRPIPPGFVEMDYKGTDIMVRGIGRFFRETGIRLDLRFIKKGLHVPETMRLLDEEGIGDQVTWCEELDQQRYLNECREADIVFDQLGRSMCGMVTLDAMAIGRPVIANGRPEVLGSPLGRRSPLCQASRPEEVCDQLKYLVHDMDARRRTGAASRQFVEQYFSAEIAARNCLERFMTNQPLRDGT